MPQRPVGLDMNLSQPNKLLRPNIIKSKLLITLLKIYSSDFGHFHVVLMKSVGQLACLLICVSANTPSPSMRVCGKLLLLSYWLINRSLKFYSRIAPIFAWGWGWQSEVADLFRLCPKNQIHIITYI